MKQALLLAPLSLALLLGACDAILGEPFTLDTSGPLTPPPWPLPEPFTPPPPAVACVAVVVDAGAEVEPEAGPEPEPEIEPEAGPPGCSPPCLIGQLCDGWTCQEQIAPCIPGSCCNPDDRWSVQGPYAVDRANGRRLWRRAVEAAKTQIPAEMVCESYGPGWRLPTVAEASSVRIINEEPAPPHACNPPMDPAVFTKPWWNPPCGPGQCPIHILLTSDVGDGGEPAQVLLYPLPLGTIVQYQNGGPFYCTHDPEAP